MTERTEYWLVRGTVGVLLMALLALAWVNRADFAPPDSGTAAPAFAYPTLAGDTVTLDSLRGKVVLLNLWATWCPPCVREMPSIEELHRQYGAEGLHVVAVSVDAVGVRGDVRRFIEDFDLTFDVLLNPSGDLQDRYGVVGLPTTFLIDREGNIRDKVVGGADWTDSTHTAKVRALLES